MNKKSSKKYSSQKEKKENSEIDYLIVGTSYSTYGLVYELITSDPSLTIVVLDTTSNPSSTSSFLSEFEKFLSAPYPILSNNTCSPFSNTWIYNSPEYWDKWEIDAEGGQDWSYDTTILSLQKKLESVHPLRKENIDCRLRTISKEEEKEKKKNKHLVEVKQIEPSSGISVYLTSIISNLTNNTALTTDYNGGISTGIDDSPQVFCLDTNLLSQIELISHAHVLSILTKPSSNLQQDRRPRATGVEFIIGDLEEEKEKEEKEKKTYKKYTLYARNIILSSGTIHSSSSSSSEILERSGIHDQKCIGQKLNIPTLVHNPNVGEHLSNTIGPTILLRRTDPLNNPVWKENEQGSIALLPFVHPLQQEVTEPDIRRWQLWSHAGFFWKPIQFPQFTTIYNLESSPSLIPAWISNSTCSLNSRECKTTNLLQMVLIDVTSTSRGSIHIQSKDALSSTFPKVHFHFYETLHDLQTAISGYQLLFRIFKQLQTDHPQEGFTLVYPPTEDLFTNPINNGSDLIPYLISSISTNSYTGSCRISKNRKTGVVNGRLRVHGVRNLYIGDLSVAPVPLEGDAISTSLLIGMNLGRMLLEKNKNKAERLLDLDGGEVSSNSNNTR